MVFRGVIGTVVSTIVAEAVGEVVVACRVVELLRTAGAGIVDGIAAAAPSRQRPTTRQQGVSWRLRTAKPEIGGFEMLGSY